MPFEKTKIPGLIIDINSGTYYINKMINNNRIRRSLKTDNATVAKERFNDIMMNSETYRKKSSGTLEKLIDEYINYCIEYRQLTQNTMKTRIPRLKKLINYFGDVSVISITSESYMKFKQVSIDKKLSKVTINNDMKVHSAFFEWCLRTPNSNKPYLLRNPLKHVEKYRINPRTRKALPFEIAQDFVESLKDKNLRIYQISKLILYTGMRIGEVLNLSFNDIDYDENKLIVRNGKWDIDRSIPMSDSVKEIIKSLPKFKSEFWRKPGNSDRETLVDNSKNLLFPEVTYYSISSKMNGFIQIYRSKKNLNQELGFHVLRHTFASKLLKNNVAIGVISEILGHKNIQTTMIYLDVQSGDKVDAINKL